MEDGYLSFYPGQALFSDASINNGNHSLLRVWLMIFLAVLR